MERLHAADSLPGTDQHESTTECRIDASFDAQYRAQVVERVLAFWSSVQKAQIREYLEPLPQTRLHAAQRAFHAVGAVHASTVLREGLFRLTRLGAPVPLSQIISELTARLPATTDNIPDLVAQFAKAPARKVVPRKSAYQPWKKRHRLC